MIAISPPDTTRSSSIRFGRHRIGLADVRSYRVGMHHEKHRTASIATVLVGTVAAMIFAIGVIEHGWRTRFWLGAAVCALIALSAVQDIFAATPIVLYRFDIQLNGGESLAFTTSDAAEAARLHDALRRTAREGTDG